MEEEKVFIVFEETNTEDVEHTSNYAAYKNDEKAYEDADARIEKIRDEGLYVMDPDFSDIRCDGECVFFTSDELDIYSGYHSVKVMELSLNN